MVEIQSKEVIDKISDELKVQPALEIPRELAKQIQLSYNINPKDVVEVRNKGLSDGTSALIHTTHSEKRTFLLEAAMSIAKDVNATSIFSTIEATPLGKAEQNIAVVRYEPLTVASHLRSEQNMHGIELEKGTEINFTHGNAAASIDGSATIFFIETDPQ